MSSVPIEIIDRKTGQPVEAELLDGLAPEDLMLLESVWTPHRLRILEQVLRAGLPHEDRPQSLNWNWRAKAQHLRLTQASGYAVVCDGQWQGAMLTKSATYFSQLGEDRGKPLIYIDFLEVAPWNWIISAIAQFGQFATVGQQLFYRAVRQSLEEGCGGRIGLHALPQSRRFYCDVCYMVSLGIDDEKEGLECFELTAKQAERLLERNE